MLKRALTVASLVGFMKQALLGLVGVIAVAYVSFAPHALATSPPLEELRTLVASQDFGPIGRKLSTLVARASARELQATALASSGNAAKAGRVLKKTIRLLVKADRLLASRRGTHVDPALRTQARALVAAALADLRSRAPGPPTGPHCRTYATAYSEVTTLNGEVSANDTATCTFSTSTHQLTCHLMLTDTNGCSFTTDIVDYYDSTADFVDEVAVIPPLVLLTRSMSSTTRSGSCSGSSAAMITYSYDSQRRLTQFVVSPPQITYTYSAWDGSGRRTMGTISTSAPTSEAWSYDDAARTATLVDTTDIPGVGPFVTTTVYTYDANGNATRLMLTAAGPTVEVMDTTITSTQRVCK